MSTEPAPAIGVSLKVGCPGERQLVFQTHMPLDFKPWQINEVLDKLAVASDRQVARYTLPLLKTQLVTETAQLDRIKADLARVDQLHAAKQAEHPDRRKPYKLSEQDKQQRTNVEVSIAAYQKQIARLEGEIAECEAKVNADKPTDHNAGLHSS